METNETLCYTTILRNSGKNENNQSIALWQFLLDLLIAKNHEHLLKWTNDCPGEFKFIDAEGVAKLWGEKRNKPRMNYDKMSRALRYYYIRGFLVKVEGKKFVYKFLDVPDLYKSKVFGNKKFTEEAKIFGKQEISCLPYSYKDNNIKFGNITSNQLNIKSEILDDNSYQLCNNDSKNCFLMFSDQALPICQYVLLPNRSLDDMEKVQLKNVLFDAINVPMDIADELENLSDVKAQNEGNQSYYSSISNIKDILINKNINISHDLENNLNQQDLIKVTLMQSEFDNIDKCYNDVHILSPNYNLPSFITSTFSMLNDDKKYLNNAEDSKNELKTPIISNDYMENDYNFIDMTKGSKGFNHPKIILSQSSFDEIMDYFDDALSKNPEDSLTNDPIRLNSSQNMENINSYDPSTIEVTDLSNANALIGEPCSSLSNNDHLNSLSKNSSLLKPQTKIRPMPLHLSNNTIQKVSSSLLTPRTSFIMNSGNSDQKIQTPINRIHFWTSLSPLMASRSPKVSMNSPIFIFPVGIYSSPRIFLSQNPEDLSDNLKTPNI